MNQAKCTTCGAGLTIKKGDKTCVCEYCQTTNIVENALALAKVDVDVTEDIKKLRANLTAFVQQNSIDEILRVSQKLLDWIPQDFVARYFFAYSKQQQNQPRFMYEFYQSPPTYTKDEWLVVFDHIKIHSELRDRQRVLSLLVNEDESFKKDYEDKYKIRERMEENYANIPRDVFICFSSYNQSIAQEVLETLERDGHSCWISTRNLRPNDADNYWINIENAIQKASLFIVISSEEAMRSKDVQQEVELAVKHEKRRFEIKIDSSKHTSLFKYAFDGIKWVDYTGSNRINLLTVRVFTELGSTKGLIKPKQKFINSSEQTHSILNPKDINKKPFSLLKPAFFLVPLLIISIVLVTLFSMNNNPTTLVDEEQQFIEEAISEEVPISNNVRDRVPSPVISINSEVQYFTFPFSSTYMVAEGFPFMIPKIKSESEDIENLRYFINGQQVDSFESVSSVPINSPQGNIVFIVIDSFNQQSNLISINYSVVDEVVLPKVFNLNNETIFHTEVIRIRPSNDGYYIASNVRKESPLFQGSSETKPDQKYSNISFVSNDFRLVWSKSLLVDEFVINDFILLDNSNLLLFGYKPETNYCSNVVSDGNSAIALLLNELGEELTSITSYSNSCDNSFFGGLEINNKIMLLSQGRIDNPAISAPQIFTELHTRNLNQYLTSSTLSDINPDYANAYRLLNPRYFTNGQVAGTRGLVPSTLDDGFFIIDNQLFRIGQDSTIKQILYSRATGAGAIRQQFSIEDDVFNVILEDKICSPYFLQNNSYEAINLNLEHIVFAFNSIIRELQDGCWSSPNVNILDTAEIGSYIFFMEAPPTPNTEVLKKIFLKDQVIYHISQVPPALTGRNENGYLIYTGNSIIRINNQLEIEGESIPYVNFSSRLRQIFDDFNNTHEIFNKVDVIVFDRYSTSNNLLIVESKPVLFDSFWEIIIPSRNLINIDWD
jgi:hypothetical protein